MLWCAFGNGKECATRGDGFVHDDAVFRDCTGDHSGKIVEVDRTFGAVGQFRLGNMYGGGIGGPGRRAQSVERAGQVRTAIRQLENFGALTCQNGGHTGIGEKPDGRTRAQKDDTLVGFEHFQRDIDGIGHTAHNDPSRTPFKPRVRPFRQQLAAGLCRDAARGLKIGLGQRPAAKQQ